MTTSEPKENDRMIKWPSAAVSYVLEEVWETVETMIELSYLRDLHSQLDGHLQHLNFGPLADQLEEIGLFDRDAMYLARSVRLAEKVSKIPVRMNLVDIPIEDALLLLIMASYRLLGYDPKPTSPGQMGRGAIRTFLMTGEELSFGGVVEGLEHLATYKTIQGKQACLLNELFAEIRDSELNSIEHATMGVYHDGV